MLDKLNITDYLQWFSIEWFQWSTIKYYHWENPLFLYFLPIIPGLYFLRWAFQFRFRQKFQIASYSNEVKSQGIIQLLRLIPFSIGGLCLAFFVIALARPQKEIMHKQQWSEGIDILMALDVSESMQLKDVQPNRLASSKEVLESFIDKRPFDRFGIVVFAGEAYTYCPLTTDHNMVKKMLRTTNTHLISNQGTAMGSAIGVSINRLIQSESKSKVIILISDGENTSGVLDPKVAAQLAYEKGIKIYTFSVGEEGSVAYGTNQTGQTMYAYSQPDNQGLKEIAEITGGKFYKATNKKSLSNFFQNLDSLEKSDIQTVSGQSYQDVYRIYLYWGLVCFMIWTALRSSFLNNYLED
jgi:Ca-activated chloride channel homolog